MHLWDWVGWGSNPNSLSCSSCLPTLSFPRRIQVPANRLHALATPTKSAADWQLSAQWHVEQDASSPLLLDIQTPRSADVAHGSEGSARRQDQGPAGGGADSYVVGLNEPATPQSHRAVTADDSPVGPSGGAYRSSALHMGALITGQRLDLGSAAAPAPAPFWRRLDIFRRRTAQNVHPTH